MLSDFKRSRDPAPVGNDYLSEFSPGFRGKPRAELERPRLSSFRGAQERRPDAAVPRPYPKGGSLKCCSPTTASTSSSRARGLARRLVSRVAVLPHAKPSPPPPRSSVSIRLCPRCP